MGTFDDEQQASQQRFLDEWSPGEAIGSLPEQLLLRRIGVLENELEVLRVVAREKSALEEVVAQLREANENLVLATVSAQSSRDDAEAANRRQNEFLAMLAHELRNPLSPISMAATLLERIPNASPQLLHLTGVIGRQVDHMAHLLDDLLDAARISSGKITLSLEPVLLSDVIDQAVETIQPRIREREQDLQVELPPEPLTAMGDRVRLTQVFTNLLGNASKYTGDGGAIRLRVAAADGALMVTVEDNGSGIAPEVLPHIFDLFTQGPRSLARSEGGLGIGLNVVRNLLAMHGGEVEAFSPGPGRGSRFSVKLPLSASGVAPAAPPPRRAAPCGRHRVLLIEDNVDACNTLKSFLAGEGHEVDAVFDGRSGLAAAQQNAYDVVVCDIGLPGLDGFDLIRALRASHGAYQPFAIALSGYGQTEDRARGLDAGFDHYLVKPLDTQSLLTLLSTVEREGAAG
jgi:signal transduction histidine kinase/ActR/RegA family two-component response regulator